MTPLPVSNIGFGGMRVYSDDANKVGQLLDIDVLVDGEPITCTVEVAWISRLADPAPAKYDVGLRFVSVPPGFLHYLTELTASRGTGTVAIIVNPRHAPLANEQLRRLMTDIDDITAIIVHGAEDDERCSCLSGVDTSAPWLERVSFVTADLHRGRAHAINAALRRALGRDEASDCFLVVGPDVVIESGAIAALHRVLVDQAHVGVVGSHVVDDTGAAQPTVFRFPSIASSIDLATTKTGPVPWLSTVCTMIRREVIDAIGLFDDSMYEQFAAADFCRRAAQAGWQTWLAAESQVTAAPRAPFGFEHTPTRDRPLFLASWDRFLDKGCGRLKRWLAVTGSIARLFITSIWMRARRLQLLDVWRYYTRPRWPAPGERRNPPK